MKIQNQETKDKLIARLRRVEGQIRGVEAMLDGERDCQEILQQLSAIRSAVQSASRVFLQEYAAACLLELEEEVEAESLQAGSQKSGGLTAERRAAARGKREKIVQDMIALLDKAP